MGNRARDNQRSDSYQGKKPNFTPRCHISYELEMDKVLLFPDLKKKSQSPSVKVHFGKRNVFEGKVIYYATAGAHG